MPAYNNYDGSDDNPVKVWIEDYALINNATVPTKKTRIKISCNHTLTFTCEAVGYVDDNDSRNCTLTVLSDNLEHGTTIGGGRLAKEIITPIYAIPKPGWCFKQWDDGSTNNPHEVLLTGDATFTAIFDASIECQITSPDSKYGVVSGTGTYMSGQYAKIEAVPSDGFTFLRWDDDNYDNPRIVSVSQDSSFRAIYEKNELLTPALHNVVSLCITNNGTTTKFPFRCDYSDRFNTSYIVQIPTLPQGYYNIYIEAEDGSRFAPAGFDETIVMDGNSNFSSNTFRNTAASLFVGQDLVLNVLYNYSKYNNTLSISAYPLMIDYVMLGKLPHKLTYYLNETLSLDGGSLIVYYNNLSSDTIPLDDYRITISGFDATTTGTKTIMVEYQGVTTNFFVSIYEKNNEPVAVETIAADKVKIWSADKTVYVEHANGNIVIADLSGRIVKTIVPASNRTEIPLSKSGIYIVRTMGKSQKVSVR